VVTFASGIKNTGEDRGRQLRHRGRRNPTFGGGVTNNGQISAGFGIEVTNVVQFGNTASAGGGIANTGTIAAKSTGILLIRNVSTFAGAINNSGKISAGGRGLTSRVSLCSATRMPPAAVLPTRARLLRRLQASSPLSTPTFGGIANKGTISAGAPSQAAIFVFEVSSFFGGIVNSTGGVISAVNAGIGALGDSIFFGGIANKGTIIANGGAAIDVLNVTTFSGGIINQGGINARLGTGVGVFGVANFAGGVTNAGAVTAAGIAGIFASGGSVFLAA
jgi:hypothetical protein